MIDSKKDKPLIELYQYIEKNYKKFPLAIKSDDIIPGEGPSDAKILFIGEAPGYHETVERRPFVGRSGKFFRKTLVDEAKISDKDVYISNIVKVRPPENRDPTPEEIKVFKPFLDEEIEIIKPSLIVTLGRFSMLKFLHDVKISQVHGRLHKVEWPVVEKTAEAKKATGGSIFVLPMYHPAAGLRNGKMRESFINDFKKIPKIVKWIEKQREVGELKDSVAEYLF